MLWHNFYSLQATVTTTVAASDKPQLLQDIISLAPLLSFLAAFCNVLIAIYIFRFTRIKNDRDRNIKWFQELIYTPNKDLIFSFFRDLHQLKSMVSQAADLNDDERINLINFVKAERNKFMTVFVDTIRPIAPDVHSNISTAVDHLIDELTTAFDNDELKWNNDKTQEREITNRITTYRNKVIIALFNYKGEHPRRA